MYWHKLKTHLIHYANELAETGYKKESDYIRNDLISQVDSDAKLANVRGKALLLERIESRADSLRGE